MNIPFTLYTKSTDAWTAMFEGISNATSSVYIEMYIFSDDTKDTHDFVPLLCEKANAGVRVTMILDAIGSMSLSKEIVQQLEYAGVEVLFFRHWLHRTHRKLVIVDGSIAFLGGVNISREASLWNDLHVRITGKSVRDLLVVFSKTYTLANGKNPIHIAGLQVKKQRIRKWILEHTPATRRGVLKKYYTQKIKMAKKSIVCVTPYFVPHAWFVRAATDAMRRSVQVSFLIPQQTDHWFMNHVNMLYVHQMHALGARVYLLQNMNHAKAMLIDNEEGMISSGNIDALSFDRNSELGIFFRDTKSCEALEDIIETWEKEAILFSPTTYKFAWYDYVLAWGIRLFAPIL